MSIYLYLTMSILDYTFKNNFDQNYPNNIMVSKHKSILSKSIMVYKHK